jgi:hypothetical protein
VGRDELPDQAIACALRAGVRLFAAIHFSLQT